jgi:hypothetical protein
MEATQSPFDELERNEKQYKEAYPRRGVVYFL